MERRPIAARLLASTAALSLIASACGQGAAPSPTAAPAARPTEAAKPAAPAATSAPAAKPTEAAKPAAGATTAPAAPRPAATAAPAAGGAPGGILRQSTLGGAPRVLHPYPESQAYTGPWSTQSALMWSSAVGIDWNTVEFQYDPAQDLATGLPRISNDGKTFTFTLRDDIKWSDGRPITAADFQFAFDNACKKENNWVGYTSTCERIESYRTPDPKAVEVTLKEQLASYLALILANTIYPIPQHVWQGKSWNDPQANPEILKPTVVSGPYMPKDISAERQVYTRNPGYWAKPGNLEEIHFVGASPQTALELLRTRQVEWTESYPPAQYEESTRIPHANVLKWTPVTALYRLMQFNLQRPYMQDLKFRQALAHAINREDLVQFEDNLGDPQAGIYPNSNPFASDNVQKYEYSLQRARDLLTEAGYRQEGGTLRGPDGQPVKLSMLWPTTSQPRGKIATYAQQQWRQLGIETEVTGLEFNAFVDRYQRQKDFDIVIGTFGGGAGDPDSAKSQLSTGGTQNATGYSNPRVDELFAQGAREQDNARRKQIYDEIQQIISQDLPHLYLLTLQQFTAIDKRVQGVAVTKGDDLIENGNGQILEWTIQQ